MLLALTLVVAWSMLPVVVISFCYFNISTFLVNWCYSGSSAVLDENLCNRGNRCKKLLSPAESSVFAVADR